MGKRMGQIRGNVEAVLRDPADLVHLPAWMMSVIGPGTLYDKGIPWFTYKTTRWLKQYVKPGMRVFEWGAGGSTVWLLARDVNLISVEMRPEWFQRIHCDLGKYEYNTWEVHLCEGWEELSTLVKGRGPFDLVIVDTRRRIDCIVAALPEITPGGYLLLDDSQDERFASGIALLDQYERQDFWGLCPSTLDPKCTSVWRITCEDGPGQ